MRGGLALLVAAVATVAVTGSARASPTSRLTYVRGPGAQGCPDEATLRRAVADRLGYDPFFPTANRTIVAQIQKGPSGYSAELKILDDAGVSLGERALPSTTSDCGEVVKSLALAISIAIDDLDTPAPSAPAPDPAPSTPPLAEPSPAAPVTPPAATASPDPGPAAPEAPRTLGLALELGGHGVAAGAPSPTLGGSLGARVVGRFWSLGVDGHYELPASDAIPGGGRVEASRALIVASACGVLVGERWRPFACVLGALGSFRATTSEVSAPRSAAALFTGAGARFGAAVALAGPVYAFGALSGLGSFTPHRAYMNGALVFTAPSVSFDVGVGLGVQIFR